MPYSQLLTFQADGATLLQLVAPCGTRRLSPATILSTVGFHQRLDLGLHLRAARDCHLPAAGVFLVARGFATGTGRSHFPERRFWPVYEKRTFRYAGFTAPIPSQPCWPVLVNACAKWRGLLLPRAFRDNFRMTTRSPRHLTHTSERFPPYSCSRALGCFTSDSR